MSALVPFTDNFHDLSNHEGYQFEFRCERCGNGYRSPFQRDKLAAGGRLLRGLGSFSNKWGIVDKLGHASNELVDRFTGSAAKDKALASAVETVRPHFLQCRACGDWVCKDVCWNHDIGQCLNCSPHVVDELSRAQAAAQVEQLREKAREIDWTRDVDVTTRARVSCPSCNATVAGGKFCPECGANLQPKHECTNCGTTLGGAKFCPECGQKA
jgi:hypothetical protein